MDERELMWAHWVALAALVLVSGTYLLTTSPLNPWVVGIIVVAMFMVILNIWRRRVAINRELHSQQNARRQVQTVLELQRNILAARSEKGILEAVMQIGGEFLRAGGVSFVPYNEWEQVLPALFQGQVPEMALQSWAARLSAPQTRQQCKNCQALHGTVDCALVPNEAAKPFHVRCFPLFISEREVGVFNFFFAQERDFETDGRFIMTESLRFAGQALANLQMRDQEMAALRYLQTTSTSKADLPALLTTLLENVQKALDVDLALLYLPGGVPGEIPSAPLLLTQARGGSQPGAADPDQPFLAGVWKSVLDSGKSLSLENVTVNKRERWKMLAAVPLTWQGEDPAGVLVLASDTGQSFAPRQQALLETLAGQAALLIQNAGLMVQVEYQAVVDERTRLAREIHDGLAQTLAFLKIQAAQMQNYLARGEMERLTNMLQANYRTLSDAYLDARQAIDNLRRLPSTSLRDWLGQVVGDFEQNTGLPVDLSQFELSVDYPLNVQAQLIRIVQEALSNVRKHANAQKVTICGQQSGASILLEVRDDGQGFAPEQASGNSRYGLRGMRERAEMIGADIQITSQPGQGTVISLRLPAPVKEEI